MTLVRPATPDDAPAMAAILSDWVDATDWLPRIHSHDDDRGFARHMVAEMEVMVAERAGEVVGFLARRAHFVHALYLDAEARGQGIGRMLVEAAREAMDELTLWTFEANRAAREFYAALGFDEVEQGDGSGNDEGLPDVRLLWRRG